jgi:hypothetical protein
VFSLHVSNLVKDVQSKANNRKENITKRKQINRKMQSKPTISTLLLDPEKSGSLRECKQPMEVAAPYDG